MTGTSQISEARTLSRPLATPKESVRVGCWNVRTMFSVGKTAQIVKEARRYKLRVLGISECRWSDFGRLQTATGETILYSGRDDDVHQSGVALLLDKATAGSLIEWNPFNDRIITARLNLQYIKTTIVQVYAPTNDAESEAKDDFYDQLQSVLEGVPKHDLLIVMGDWNAKVGQAEEGEEGIIGKYPLCGGIRNDNGERFVNFCAMNDLLIASTVFPHKDIHKYTWTSPNSKFKNQIDHITINNKFRRSMTDTRTYRGADMGSDHNLVLAKIKLKLCRIVRPRGTREMYDVNKLRNPEIQKEFVLELRNRFSCLTEEETESEDLDSGGNDNIERCWKNVKTAYSTTAKKVLGYKKRKSKTWISMNSWKEIEERRKLKKKINDAKSERLRKRWQEEYRKKDKLVKRSLRRDKREWANDIAKEAENAANVGDMKGVYNATRKLCNDRPKNIAMVKDKEGRLLTKEDEIKKRWRDHFTEVLNRPAPTDRAIIRQDTPINEAIDTGYITKEEIRRAIGNMKNGKAAGIDSITVEMLKADVDETTNVLHMLFQKIWDQEEIPDDWSKSLIVKLPKKGDLTACGNWRGITLIPTAAKVMGRVIITRIRDGINQQLRDEQAGYRSGRSTTEQIFVLRNIIEQVIEWNSCLYLCFVDFEKAFDSVHRETLWHLLKSYGIPTKLVNMVKAMYKNCRCAVIDETSHLEWFEVLSGVRQGCVMSGFLFLIVIDWVMRRTVENNRNGIRWKLTTTLDDLDFADDLALLSSRWSQAQDKLNRLSQFGGKVGLKINIDKTKVLRYNPRRLDPLLIRERNVEDVESFVYLGAKVDKQGGAAGDIRARIGKARAAFNKLNKVWKSSLLSQETKITIFKTNVVAILL